jgi:CheY-like chemotaxis protein
MMARKLLLADDSITIQKVVELVLAEEDFEIKSVGNGEDALRLMDSFRPDIVLADIEMPRMNGYQLCEKIKQDPSTAGTPVILLAGAFEPIDEELSRKVGADDSVIKPFESQELISKLNAALTMVSAGGGEEISFAEVAEAGDEAIELMEEAEAGIEGEEVLAEAVGAEAAEEDLWAMEEISEGTESLAAEAVIEAVEEEAVSKTAFEIPGWGPEHEAPTPSAQPGTRQGVIQEVAMPSREELLKVFERSVNDKVASLTASLDLKEALLTALMPSLKDSIEKILWEVAPDLVEKMLRETLKSSVSSITKEVEKVIWETVPDLAGTMISKEIEKIKSEF